MVVVVDELLLQSHNLNSVVLVFALLKLRVVVEQIVQLAAVDLVHGHGDSEVTRVVLPVVDTALKQILHSDRLNAVHSVRLAGARLTIRKDCDDTLVEDEVKNGTHLEEVELLVGVVLIKRVVKFEVIVLNSLGHAVHFIAAVVNNYLWVDHRHYINLAISQLVLENGPLLEADRNLHLISQRVHLSRWQLGALRLDHMLEVHVDLDTLKLVIGLSLRFESSSLLHLHSARITVQLDLIDLVGRCDSPLQLR